MDRYARQEIIEGWDQSRLRGTTLLVVGSGLLARFASLLGTAMGFGRIVLMGNGRVKEADRRFLLADVRTGSSVVRTWAQALGRVNPEVEVHFAHDVPCERSLGDLPKPDVILEASQDLRWKAQVVGISVRRGIDLILAAAGPQVGFYQVGRRLHRDLCKFWGAREDPLVSLTLAALIVEEVRRLQFRLGPNDRPADGPVYVSPEALHRRAGGAAANGEAIQPGETPRINLVGAGALGTWAGIGLGMAARSDMCLTVYDPDGVEATNLNRQVLFGDALNTAKATALADRLTALFPEIEAEGRVEAVTEATLADACEADLMVCGPDTFSARALLHRGALDAKTPLVNSGTSAFGADVAAYVPGRSPCLECSLRVATVAKAVGEKEYRARCAGVPEPSVVTSSALAGALMAFEARAALDGRPIRGVLEYDGQAQGRRLGVRSVKKPCLCHHKERKSVGRPWRSGRSQGGGRSWKWGSEFWLYTGTNAF